jgi:hypothetical protein
VSDANAVKVSIQRRFDSLRRQDRELRHAALIAVSAQTRPLFEEMEDECAKTGHAWKFDSWNFNHTCAWDKCMWCGAAEPADRHTPDNAVPTSAGSSI